MYWQVVRGPVTGFRHGVSFERLGHSIKCVSLNRGVACNPAKNTLRTGACCTAADAIRFAIQELPPELLLTAQLKAAERKREAAALVPRNPLSLDHPAL
jgi:hypothetical protein